jgi:hypothetical protein
MASLHVKMPAYLGNMYLNDTLEAKLDNVNYLIGIVESYPFFGCMFVCEDHKTFRACKAIFCGIGFDGETENWA